MKYDVVPINKQHFEFMAKYVVQMPGLETENGKLEYIADAVNGLEIEWYNTAKCTVREAKKIINEYINPYNDEISPLDAVTTNLFLHSTEVTGTKARYTYLSNGMSEEDEESKEEYLNRIKEQQKISLAKENPYIDIKADRKTGVESYRYLVFLCDMTWNNIHKILGIETYNEIYRTALDIYIKSNNSNRAIVSPKITVSLDNTMTVFTDYNSREKTYTEEEKGEIKERNYPSNIGTFKLNSGETKEGYKVQNVLALILQEDMTDEKGNIVKDEEGNIVKKDLNLIPYDGLLYSVIGTLTANANMPASGNILDIVQQAIKPVEITFEQIYRQLGYSGTGMDLDKKEQMLDRILMYRKTDTSYYDNANQVRTDTILLDADINYKIIYEPHLNETRVVPYSITVYRMPILFLVALIQGRITNVPVSMFRTFPRMNDERQALILHFVMLIARANNRHHSRSVNRRLSENTLLKRCGLGSIYNQQEQDKKTLRVLERRRKNLMNDVTTLLNRFVDMGELSGYDIEYGLEQIIEIYPKGKTGRNLLEKGRTIKDSKGISYKTEKD